VTAASPAEAAARPVRLLRLRAPADGSSWSGDPGEDWVAAEEPLEIRVEGRGVAVVMRTPGHDRELVAGFLVTEGLIRSAADLFDLGTCPESEASGSGNVVDVFLRNPDEARLEKLTRHVFSASSCGICGKTTLDSVLLSFPPVDPGSGPRLPADLLRELPPRLRAAQETFQRTGGLHASALFDAAGDLRLVREDVGRHNALDKVIGHSLLEDALPLSESVLLVSGRISFELMQKSLAAGIPVVAGISAPSSLAVDFARSSGQTLVGFLREGGGNIYAGEHRIVL
jgi:FdhD protein